MIKAIKEWFWPTLPEILTTRWNCQKHGDGKPSIVFYGNDGKKIAACILCICDAYPLTEIKK